MKTFACHAGAPLLKPDDVELLITGRAQMVTPFGQKIPHRLNTAGRGELEAATRRGWCEAGTEALRNAWWAWCEAHGHPCVHIHPWRGKWRVRMDLLHYPTREGLQDAVREVCRSYAVGSNHYFGRYTQLNVEVEDAATVASLLVDLAKRFAG